jgi:hypothetical protein
VVLRKYSVREKAILLYRKLMLYGERKIMSLIAMPPSRCVTSLALQAAGGRGSADRRGDCHLQRARGYGVHSAIALGSERCARMVKPRMEGLQAVS